MIRSRLTIAVAQPHIEPYDVDANVATHAAIICDARSRVVVFP
jgi:predicted amidohydrolase